MKDYSQERIENEEKIKELWNAGFKAKEIIPKLDICFTHARAIIHDMRIDGTLGNKGLREETKQKRDEIVNLYKQGLNKYEIAEKLGLKATYVNFVLCHEGTYHKRPQKNYIQSKQYKTSDKTSLIVSDIKSGLRACEIAAKYSVSRQYISRLQKEIFQDVLI